MAVKKSGEGHGSPFELLLTIAYTAVPTFDYQSFVGEHGWLLDVVAAAGKAGGFTMEVVEANVPEDFQEKATPIEVMNLIEFMNAYSEKKGWLSLLEMAAKPEADEPKTKRPYHRKTRKGPYLRPRPKAVVHPGGTSAAVRTTGKLSLSKPALIKKHGTALMALATIQSEVDKAGGVRMLSERWKVKASVLYNLMTVLRKEAAGTTSVTVSKKTRRTKKRKAGKREFRIRKKGLRALATAALSRKKSPHQTKLQRFIAAVGTEKQATVLLNTTYKSSGTQSKAAAAIVRIAGEKGLKGFKLTQRELCDWFRKLNIAPLHPGRGPARKKTE